ncbi:MAG TPA: aminotransferase class V-fold PLP-dependent enzyme, partial [Pseudonocardiaceae bacterium]|nr:aminotransferase class V-fold PLP-dependent enzyme [Pseudonocardiaceae bacterium]
LVGRVLAVVPDAVRGGDRGDQLIDGGPSRLPGNAHLSFPGCEGDSLVMLMDAQGIECSTGSACTAGVARPSHVLLAMGADEAVARGSLRFSFGHTSTPADVAAVARVIGPVVERARRAGYAGSRQVVRAAGSTGGGERGDERRGGFGVAAVRALRARRAPAHAGLGVALGSECVEQQPGPTGQGEWKHGAAGTWGCRPFEGQAGVGGDDHRAGSGAG